MLLAKTFMIRMFLVLQGYSGESDLVVVTGHDSNCNAPVNVSPRENMHITGVCLTIQGTLTTTFHSDIILTLEMVEI